MTAFAQAAPDGADCSAFHFEIANPSPGLRIDPGVYVLQGVALDKRAEEGAGIERIDFFLGSRDQGGTIIGQAFPAAVNAVTPFGQSSFQTTIRVPNVAGGRELFGYAHSAMYDQEAIISIPIAVGVEPATVGELMASPGLRTCSPAAPLPVFGETQLPGPAAEEAQGEPASEVPVSEMAPAEEPGGSSEMAPAEEPSAAAPESPAPQEEAAPPDDTSAPEESPVLAELAVLPAPLSATARMFFEVGNPSRGADVHVGDLLIEGIAFDRAADEGLGISRIDVFVDDRDAGGFLIGSAQLGMPNPAPDEPRLRNAGWRARVTLPSNLLGERTLYFYALSGATGGETVITIPIRVVP